MTTDQLRRSLLEHAEEVETGTVQQRLAAVDARVVVLRRRRQVSRLATGLLVVVAVVAALVVVPHLTPATPHVPHGPPQKVLAPPPDLAGDQLPATLTVGKVSYEYYRSIEAPTGWGTFRVTVTASPHPQAIVWATPDGTPGRLVVTLDGHVVSRTRAGQLQIGLTVSPRRAHLVVLHLVPRSPEARMGIAVYRWPQG